MGATCSNCNCNKDERDELKIDEKLNLAGANGDRAGRSQYHYAGEEDQERENQLNGVAAVFGQQTTGNPNQRNNKAYAAQNGLEPTGTFDDHHYSQRQHANEAAYTNQEYEYE